MTAGFVNAEGNPQMSKAQGPVRVAVTGRSVGPPCTSRWWCWGASARSHACEPPGPAGSPPCGARRRGGRRRAAPSRPALGVARRPAGRRARRRLPGAHLRAGVAGQQPGQHAAVRRHRRAGRGAVRLPAVAGAGGPAGHAPTCTKPGSRAHRRDRRRAGRRPLRRGHGRGRVADGRGGAGRRHPAREPGRQLVESPAAAACILRDGDMTRVVLVTDGYHALRVEAIAGDLGLDAAVPSRRGGGLGHYAEETAAVALGRVGFRPPGRHRRPGREPRWRPPSQRRNPRKTTCDRTTPAGRVSPAFGGGVIGNTTGSGPVIGGSSPPPEPRSPRSGPGASARRRPTPARARSSPSELVVPVFVRVGLRHERPSQPAERATSFRGDLAVGVLDDAADLVPVGLGIEADAEPAAGPDVGGRRSARVPPAPWPPGPRRGAPDGEPAVTVVVVQVHGEGLLPHEPGREPCSGARTPRAARGGDGSSRSSSGRSLRSLIAAPVCQVPLAACGAGLAGWRR